MPRAGQECLGSHFSSPVASDPLKTPSPHYSFPSAFFVVVCFGQGLKTQSSLASKSIFLSQSLERGGYGLEPPCPLKPVEAAVRQRDKQSHGLSSTLGRP